MQTKASQVIDWIERLIDEKTRLESINSKRDELLKRNVSKELIQAGIEESKRKIGQVKQELGRLLAERESK
jgi:hypothetical protein